MCPHFQGFLLENELQLDETIGAKITEDLRGSGKMSRE
jgi:hypothetical protein